jgi:hypothetical protein
LLPPSVADVGVTVIDIVVSVPSIPPGVRLVEPPAANVVGSSEPHNKGAAAKARCTIMRVL